MSLKMLLEKAEWDKLEEGIQKLYGEKDGKYTLAVEGIEDTSRLKSALAAERANVKEREKKIKAWEALGKTPEEIGEALKKLEESQKNKTPPKEGESELNAVTEQLKAMQTEMAALRKDHAETSAREKQREREARISKLFDGYSEEQRGDFMLLVKGETEEEVSASVKSLKERYPLPAKPPAGGPTNPRQNPKEDDDDEDVKAAKAMAAEKAKALEDIRKIGK